MGLNCRGIIKLNNLDFIIKKLVQQMKEKFPNRRFSVIVNLWDDHTYRIQCKHGEPIKDGTAIIHIWQYYKNKYSYETITEKTKL